MNVVVEPLHHLEMVQEKKLLIYNSFIYVIIAQNIT
jgi:hypothetical protein